MFRKSVSILFSTWLLLASAVGRADECARHLSGAADESVRAETFEKPGEGYTSRVTLVNANARAERKAGGFARLMRFPGPVDLALVALSTDLLYRQPDHAKPAILGMVLILVYRGLARVVRGAGKRPTSGTDPATDSVEPLAAMIAHLEANPPFDPVVVVIPRDEVEVSAGQLIGAGYLPVRRASVELALRPSFAGRDVVPFEEAGRTPVTDQRKDLAEFVEPLGLSNHATPTLATVMLALAPPFEWPPYHLAVPLPLTPIERADEIVTDPPASIGRLLTPEPAPKSRRAVWLALPRLRPAPKLAAFVGAMLGMFFGHGSPADPGATRPNQVDASPASPRPWTGIAADRPPELPPPALPEPTRFALSQLPAVVKTPTGKARVVRIPPPKVHVRLVEHKPGKTRKLIRKVKIGIRKNVSKVKARLAHRRKR